MARMHLLDLSLKPALVVHTSEVLDDIEATRKKYARANLHLEAAPHLLVVAIEAPSEAVGARPTRTSEWFPPRQD